MKYTAMGTPGRAVIPIFVAIIPCTILVNVLKEERFSLLYTEIT